MSTTKKGFTLIELVAAIGLLAVVIPLIFSVYMAGNSIYAAGLRIENVETNGRQALEQMSQDIKISKLLIGTEDLTNATGQGSVISNPVYLDGTNIARSDLISYIETYSGQRYLYAYRNSAGGKKELHRMTLVDQIHNYYSIPSTSVEEALNNEDNSKLDPNKNSQEIVKNFPIGEDISYYVDNLIDYKYSTINKCLLYDNNGDDCYLVDTVLNFKRKLVKDFKPDLSMPIDKTSEMIIARYINSVTITNNTNSAEIQVGLSSGTTSKTIDTNVNILNQ